jgi:gliding motility-associated-like protein
VTASDGITKKTYAIKITRLPSSNATLSILATTPKATLTVAPGADYRNFVTTVNNLTSSIRITPTVVDATATITVNGVPVASGTASDPIQLNVDTNTIYTTVTAADGVTKKTYAVKITRLASANATLSSLVISPKRTLTVVPGTNFRDFETTVLNSTNTINVIATTLDAAATLTINGVSATSGIATAPIQLNMDTTTIYTTVTAADRVTKKTYGIKITRQVTPITAVVMQYQQQESTVTNAAIIVHQNVSPNGDGNSDALVIEGIAAHPDNKLQIMSRSGALVYEAKGYDNATKSFDGHSSTNGKLQQPGTYFYSLEYKDGNEVKHKTGFIVLKY